ncbi:Hpt domain-containing protein [Pseudoalteromonas sp. MMG006]|uniref:Hpt domain-containing protein n=1 Tax=unclassified Pseudoalteromonas TaxID=194690 RepID=UPI001B39887A|nr:MULTISPECIES: Hpt domain-containing protein [unclassified Pseudoalteromonas]MBQ4798210.1 Hpt domain-containing protein [Pseudoalteromonas sp. MMG006]MBQ4857972.1 Hpt domain-containing protein [Pseudoalteromonas sp. MMG007]
MPISEKFVDKSITELNVLAQLEKDVGVEVLAKLIKLFIDELITMSEQIKIAIDNEDTVKIKEITHILKNSAALYGAAPLAALATQLHDSPPATTAENLHLALIIQHNLDKTHDAYQIIINNIGI